MSRFVLAFVFLSAALPKLLSRFAFERAVGNYRLLPTSLVRPVATWLPRFELLGALALLLGIAVAPVAASVALLLAVFAVAIGVNLARGRSIDCGCFNSTVPRRIGWRLVLGDISLAAAAALVALEPNPLVSTSDAVALALLAAAVVLGQQLLTSWRELDRAVRELRGQEAGA